MGALNGTPHRTRTDAHVLDLTSDPIEPYGPPMAPYGLGTGRDVTSEVPVSDRPGEGEVAAGETES
jgi:hypothetical protein